MKKCRVFELTDVTFVIPIRIDSNERKKNLETLINILIRDYHTNIIIIEADNFQKVNIQNDSVEYHFIFDNQAIFHRTKYLNQLLNLATTPIVAIWDADAIALPHLVLDAVNKIKLGEYVMSFPYDGRFYDMSPAVTQTFQKTLNYNLLEKNISMMHLMHGYYSVGGAFIVDKSRYIKIGGENENFLGWGPEDAERVKRIEINGLSIYRSVGPLFHLSHPRLGWFANYSIECQNRKAFLDTCATTSDNIKNKQSLI